MRSSIPFGRCARAAACALFVTVLALSGYDRAAFTYGSAHAATPAQPLPNFTALVKTTGPAVVNLTTVRTARSVAAVPYGDIPGRPGDPIYEFFRRFIPQAPGAPQMPEAPQQQGLGSGFIISSDGYILTNAHVVADADEVTVRLADSRREFKAKVIGADERTDVALIKVEAAGLPVVKLGSSENLQVGEWVAAIGSPFGFANTVTAGIVSAKKRNLADEYFVPFLQTDVAVNPGNSGGPLLNLAGEVVGVNSMIYSGTGGYMGLSFAIPIEVALDVARQLQATGKVSRGRLGVSFQEVTVDLAKSFGLDKPLGALIGGVEPESPAAQAGLQSGDVILRYNGQLIDEANELPRLVAATKPGSQAKLEVWRAKASREVTVTVGELPSQKVAAASPSVAPKAERLGLSVRPASPEQLQALGVKFALVVEAIDPAARAPQLNPGDVIVAINNTEFASLRHFNEIVSRQKPGDSVALLVRRDDAALYVPVRVQG